MTQRFLFFILLLSLASCVGSRGNYMLQEKYSTDNIPPKPEYTNEKYWSALPSRKDAPDTTPGKQYKDMQAEAKVDVFFIHPTTYTYQPKEGAYKWNADVNDQELNTKTDASTIRYQASVFNGACKIYAPRYRQAHVSTFFTRDTATYFGPLAIAYSDVKNAFDYYLKHYNKGRSFIIASHSQGTLHARRLIRDVIEVDSSLDKRLVAAYLVGYAVLNDSFVNLKPCATPAATRCYCTWNTFATGYYPPWYNDGLFKAQATNPLTWTTDTIYAPYEMNKGGVLQNFNKVIPKLTDAQVHHGLVWINKPRVRGGRFVKISNYHIGDYNLFYMNIRENVIQRVEAYLKENP